MKRLKLGEQSSLNSFDITNEDLFEAFEKQVRPRKQKPTFQPQIAMPHSGDRGRPMDWDEFNKRVLYPCYEATKIPVGGERDKHCENCSECKHKMERMDRLVIPGNKWLSKDNPKSKEVINSLFMKTSK